MFTPPSLIDSLVVVLAEFAQELAGDSFLPSSTLPPPICEADSMFSLSQITQSVPQSDAHPRGAHPRGARLCGMPAEPARGHTACWLGFVSRDYTTNDNHHHPPSTHDHPPYLYPLLRNSGILSKFAAYH